MPGDTRPHKAREAKKRHARLRKSGTIADMQRELWRTILCAKEKDAFSGEVFFLWRRGFRPGRDGCRHDDAGVKGTGVQPRLREAETLNQSPLNNR